jgi:hypothetical protein
MADSDGFLRTDVDLFLDLIKKVKRISMPDAAKALNMPIKVIHAWSDFLVEEKIVGIEYKFTTPYLYLNEKIKDNMEMPSLGFETKEIFYEKAKKKGLPENKIKLLWLKYINTNKAAIKEVFIQKTREKNIDRDAAEKLWLKYLNYLETDKK